MAKFEIADAATHINEVGYQNYADDNGNWTGGKKGVGAQVGTINGITAAEVMAYLKRTPTVDDVKNFPVSAQKEIYRKKYWNVIRGDEIVDQQTANILYDEAVNAGSSKSIREAQFVAGLPQTGKMDDATLNYINNPS